MIKVEGLVKSSYRDVDLQLESMEAVSNSTGEEALNLVERDEEENRLDMIRLLALYKGKRIRVTIEEI